MGEKPTIKQLLDELKEVTEWESLGTFLGLRPHKLAEIQTDRRGKVSLCKMDMFDQWLRSDLSASWGKVVQALDSMGEDYNSLAHSIRGRHNLGPGPGQMQVDYQPPQVHHGSSGAGNRQYNPPAPAPHPPQTSTLSRNISDFCGKNLNANQTSPNELKQSILQMSVGVADLNMIKTLIVLGADLNYKDSQGFTAMDTASRMSNLAISTLIERCGGRSTLNPNSVSSMMEVESGGDEMRVQDQSNVLCLDSSSEKAIVQLEILNRIEQQAGKKLTDLFEYFVGSGLGGAMLLAMVYGGKTVPQLIRIYYQLWQLLASEGDPMGKWRQLEDFMYKLFGGARLEDRTPPSAPKLLIGAVNRETTQLKLKFFTNFASQDSSLRVYRVACYTCATPEFYDVIKRDNDNFISGGAICRNLTESAITFITETETRPLITGVVSVGEGVWPARQLTDDIDFHACAMDAAAEQVHQNCKCRYIQSPMFYYRMNPLFPEQTPVFLQLDDIVNLHINTIAALVGEDSSNTASKLKSVVAVLSA